MPGIRDYLEELQSKSPWTVSHMKRVEDICRKIGNFDDSILIAASVHDIGKLRVPTWMLQKNGNLRGIERIEMMRHCDHAADMIPDKDISLLVRNHHEHYDGTGYYGLKGDDIPYGSRVIAVADAFDALTSDRPYRKGFGIREALEMMERESYKYDPGLLRRLHLTMEASSWDSSASAGDNRLSRN